MVSYRAHPYQFRGHVIVAVVVVIALIRPTGVPPDVVVILVVLDVTAVTSGCRHRRHCVTTTTPSVTLLRRPAVPVRFLRQLPVGVPSLRSRTSIDGRRRFFVIWMTVVDDNVWDGCRSTVAATRVLRYAIRHYTAGNATAGNVVSVVSILGVVVVVAASAPHQFLI